MERIVRCIALAFLSLAIASAPVRGFAQNPDDEKAGQSATKGPVKHVATIVFAGLAGAVLGLSTLSFYGRPQDKLSNIAVGFAVGVIAGTVYTTFKAATEPRDFYNSSYDRPIAPQALELLDSPDRLAVAEWTPKASYVFEF
ncbi:MAG: hypothetical protein AB7F86_03270 [Bdellovibrionales bacterium]